jgi:hypothetical protein
MLQGRHQGDWETVTVRVSNIDPVGSLIGVFMSQHGHMAWLPAAEVALPVRGYQ